MPISPAPGTEARITRLPSQWGTNLRSPIRSRPATAWLASHDPAFAILDRLPVSEGHTLLVPERPLTSKWDPAAAEQHALLAQATQVRVLLGQCHRPDGWSCGGQRRPGCRTDR